MPGSTRTSWAQLHGNSDTFRRKSTSIQPSCRQLSPSQPHAETIFNQIQEALDDSVLMPLLNDATGTTKSSITEVFKYLFGNCDDITDQISMSSKPPYFIHRRDAAEFAIQTWKSHFISGLDICHPTSPLSEWDRLIPSCNITINLHRSSRR